ncbi:hypothetical protein [Aureivirga sp. CE67]|uniref:hypothetical protein n=1 Tax=Aureivirga sp. CE67 TaxID=1788983 RepID=UPI0018CB99F0|nr:hypothetical protein [Aureivirga sp. CE67]
MNLEKDIKYASEVLDPFLKEDRIYYSNPIVTSYGISGGSIYILKDNAKFYDFEEEKEISDAENRCDLLSITENYPEHTKLLFQFEKGKLMTVKVYDIPMLIEELKQSSIQDFNQRKYLNKSLEITFSNNDDEIQTSVIINKKYENREVERVSDYCDGDIICLYNLLETKPKKMKFIYDGENFQIQSSIAFPEYRIEKIQETTDILDFNPKEIASIYNYLESFDDLKIAKSLDVLKENESLKNDVEKRYLNFIQLRLNEKKATIFDYEKAAPTKAEIEFFLDNERWGKRFDFISFSYCNDNESKLIVDLIGTVVKNNIHFMKTIMKFKQTNNEQFLSTEIDKYKKLFTESLAKEMNISKDGWYSKICTHLFIVNEIQNILFEKTSFEKANQSLGLEPFMLYLIFNQNRGTYFDIYQSDASDLTKLFWMFRDIPFTTWQGVKAIFPESELAYKRKAKYSLEDDSDEAYLIEK